MRKMLLGSFLMVGLLAYAQSPIADRIQPSGVSEGEIGAVESRGGSVLFSTFSGIVPPGVPGPITAACQNFTDDGFDYQAVAADDFSVDGNGWVIDTVEVRGAYFNPPGMDPPGPAESINVYILGNSGTLPDTTNLSAGAIYAAEGLSYSDVNSGDFLVSLPGDGVLLLPGDYWVVVQPNMEFLVGGQWGWTESSSSPDSGTPVGSKSAWFQTPFTFIGGSCLDAWGERLDTCGIGNTSDAPLEYDLAFELSGVALTPGVSVSKTTLTTSEGMTTDNFDVVLTAPPVGGNTVTVPIGAPDASEGSVSTASLDFTAANWDIPQTVTVTGVDDAVADGNVMYTLSNGPTSSGDAAYDGLTVDDVDVTNLDNETAGFTVSTLNISVSEDGLTTATVDINLNTPLAPGESVDLPISSSDTGIATVDTAMLTFTDADGTSPQTVTVTGEDDDIDGGNTPFTVITGDPASGTNAIYDALTATDVPDVNGTRTDDDTAGISVSPTSASTSENMTTDTFDVVLDSEPTGDVTIGLSVSDPSEGSLSDMSLTFTAANWDTPQTVTITGEDDDIDDGDVSYNVITQPATSADGNYDGIDPVDVDVVNADDTDTTGITVNPTSGLITTEAGGTDTFDVVLDSEPVFPVDIPVSTDNPSEGLISDDGITFGSSLTLTFDESNWDTPQTVTIEGQDDAIRADGDILYNIVTGDPTSGDANYNNLTAGDVPDVSVTNQDNDGAAGISVSPVSGLETDEDGGTDTFAVVLDTEPTADVSIDVTSTDPGEGVADVATLVFTAANWNTPQVVTVTGVADFVIDGDIPFSIVLDPAVSGDVNYNGIDPDDVTATNFNTDVCGPVELVCEIGGSMTANGTDFCVIDVYNANGSSNPADWTLLASGVDLGANGTATVPGVICQQDTTYIATPTGTTAVILSTFRTVPTLGEWGLMAFVFLLAVAGVVQMRRRREA
jgi:hypothetical protein